MVDKNDLIVVAVLLGAHGVRGDCRVKSFTSVGKDALTYGPLFGEDGTILVTPEKMRPVKDHYIVTPRESRQKEDWDGLKGTLLHVYRDALPELGPGEVYIEDMIGAVVVDEAGAPLGTVKAIHNFGAGDLLDIAPAGGGKSVMVPFTEEDVPKVDLAKGRLVVTSFDIWADESGERDA